MEVRVYSRNQAVIPSSMGHIPLKNGPLDPTLDVSVGRRAPRWYLAYFLLAAFDLLTISGSLYLNHTIMGMFSGSVAVNGEWATRLSELATLRFLAGKVNAPGNDVFDSQNVLGESARLDTALKSFEIHHETMLREFSENLSEQTAGPLVEDMQHIQTKMDEMVEEAHRIFSFFLAGQPGLAGERMATMDRKYAGLHEAIGTVEAQLRSLQVSLLTNQKNTALWFQRFEYVIAGLIFLMVGAASLYGHRIYRETTRAAHEKEELLQELKESREILHGVVNHVVDGIITINAGGIIESFNHAATRIFGYPEKEVLGKNVSVLMPSPDREHHDSYLSNYRETGEAKIIGTGREVLGLRKEGETFPLDLGISELRVNGQQKFIGLVRDITERKKRETEILNLSNKLLLSTQSAKMGIWEWDVQEDLLVWDEQMYALYGLKISIDPLTYETWTMAVDPRDKDRTLEEIQWALEDKKVFDTEFRSLWPDGSTHWIEAHAVVQGDANGNPIRMTGVNWDISERKNAEAALIESERRLDLANRGANDGIWDWVDVTLEEEWWSPRFYALLGYAPGEISSNRETFRGLLHPDDREATFAAVQHHFQDRVPFDREYRLQTKSGDYKWFRSRGNSIWGSDGNPIRMAGSIQDISKTKHAEEAIARLLQDKQMLLNSAGEGIYGLDAHGCTTFVNPTAATLLGYEPEELIGKPMHAMVHHSRADGTTFPREECPMYAAFHDGLVHHGVSDEVLWRKEGTSFPVEYSSLPLWEGDALVGAVVTFRDITERRQDEEELRLHREHLQDLVDQRTHELSLAKESAERANQAKSEFLANMSHELRTPMHAILSFAGMAGEKIDVVPSEKITHYLTRIRDSGDRLMALLNDLLDLSKLESGKMHFVMQEENLSSLVEKVLVDCEGLVKEKGVSVHLHEMPGQALVECDANSIRQMVLNLLSNALKVSSSGKTIIISIKPDALSSERRMGEQDTVPALALVVQDEGVGIPDDELETVFDKFVQSSKTKTGAGGTGLGLAICQEIVSAHNGKIWVENLPDGGASFSVLLPLRQSEVIHAQKEKRNEPRSTDFASS